MLGRWLVIDGNDPQIHLWSRASATLREASTAAIRKIHGRLLWSLGKFSLPLLINFTCISDCIAGTSVFVWFKHSLADPAERCHVDCRRRRRQWERLQYMPQLLMPYRDDVRNRCCLSPCLRYPCHWRQPVRLNITGLAASVPTSPASVFGLVRVLWIDGTVHHTL